jgi:hypothetical protein
MPKEKGEKDKKGKKAAAKKAPPKKKDEKPVKPIQWEAEKGKPPATTLDLVRQAVSSIQDSVFPLNIR